MIHNDLNIWLLRPGVGGFSLLPELLDDTDPRPAAVQLGAHWQAILNEPFRLHGDGLTTATLSTVGVFYALLGAIRLPAAHELVMLFEDTLAAIVQSDRSMQTSRIPFEV
jgi:hypothetical protein